MNRHGPRADKASSPPPEIPVMTDTPARAATPAPVDTLRLALIVLAAMETLSAVSHVAVLSGDLHDIGGRGLAGALAILELFIAPFFAIAALIFAIRGKLRLAIAAIAAITFAVALSYVPQALRSGLYQPGTGLLGVNDTAKLTLYPLLALAAIALALRNRWLVLAAILVAIPMLAGMVALTLFSMSIGYAF
jgi:hypothetical protein